MLLSSTDFGLFVVKPDWEAIEAIPPGANLGSRTRSREMLESVNGVTCALEQQEICEPPVM